MKYVPEADRATWHEKAMGAAEGANVQSLIQLLTETGELARLAAMTLRAADLELEGVSHFVAEPAAERLERSCPGAAARLWSAQGLRIVKAKLSRQYDAALAGTGARRQLVGRHRFRRLRGHRGALGAHRRRACAAARP